MRNIINSVLDNSFIDYSNNQSSIDEIQKFRDSISHKYRFSLDISYLNFLMELNGFELNGLNFYGTKKQENLYVLSSIEQNDFWRTEIDYFKSYFLIGDGDMNFYSF